MVNKGPEAVIADRLKVLSVEKRTPDSINYPSINAGMCEFCGQLYKECKHYSGADIYCTYCQRDDMIFERKLNVFALKSKPGQLIVVCNDYLCEKKHNKRFLPSLDE